MTVAVLAAGVACAGIASAGSSGGSFVVPPGEQGGGALACKKGKLATGGGYTGDVNFAWELLGNYPAGRRWKVRGFNHDDEEKSGKVRALCAKADRYFIKRRRVTLELKPGGGERKSVRARCPRGTTLAGGGFQPTKGLSDPGSAGFNVLESLPATARAWRARFYAYSNPGGTYKLKVRAVCDRELGKYVVRRDDVTVEPRLMRRGEGAPFTVTAACPSGSRLSSGGFSSGDDANVSYDQLRPRNNGWTILGGAQTDEPIVAYALCRK